MAGAAEDVHLDLHLHRAVGGAPAARPGLVGADTAALAPAEEGLPLPAQLAGVRLAVDEGACTLTWTTFLS